MIALLEAHRAGLLAPGHWQRNVVSGVVVGIVALPLAMAFAIASGAKPEQGLYTAIVAGFLSAAFGGSRLQVSGPTGAFIVILSGITAQYGIAGLQIATLMAGFMLLAMGLARMGAVIKYIPDPVIVGFTTGIAVIIWVGQWKDFFGLTVTEQGAHFHDKLWHLIEALPTLQATTTLLALLSVAILLLAPRFFRRIPAPLVALVGVTLVQAIGQFQGVATIGSAFGGIPQALPSFQPMSVTFGDVVRLVGPAFTIALLGAIESLLSAVVADGMTGTRHDSNQELIGQGVANIAAPLFGGFASTGAIARTATNVRNGANSPLSGMVHALTLVVIILVAAPLAAYIPLAVLAAILFVVAWNMSELPHFWHMTRRAPRPDAVLLWITFLLTVFADLVVAVNVGVVLASLLFMRRMARAVEVQPELDAMVLGARPAPGVLPPDTVVYGIHGPFFFGAAEKLERTLVSIQSSVKTLVLRMGHVPFADATGLQTLQEIVEDFQRQGCRVVLVELKDNVRAKIDRSGLLARVGKENVYPSLADFVASVPHAEEQPLAHKGVAPL